MKLFLSLSIVLASLVLVRAFDPAIGKETHFTRQLKTNDTGFGWRDDTHLILNTPVNIKWYGAKGDGITDDTSALLASFAQLNTNKQCLYIPKGTYLYSQTLLVTNSNVRIIGDGPNSVLQYIGNGTNAMWIGAWNDGVHLRDFTISGDASTVNTLCLAAVYRGTVANMRLRNSTRAPLLLQGTVLMDFQNVMISSIDEPWTVAPTEGIYVMQYANGISGGGVGVGMDPNSCTFHNITIEGIAGTGINITTNCGLFTFNGGTVEHCQRGINVAWSCSGNRFAGMDLEGNSQTDFTIDGTLNQLICNGSAGTNLISGRYTQMYGGLYNTLTISNVARRVMLEGVSYDMFGSGGFTNLGQQTQIRDLWHAATDENQQNSTWLDLVNVTARLSKDPVYLLDHDNGEGMNTNYFMWHSAQSGYIGAFYNSETNDYSNVLLLRTDGLPGTSRALTVSDATNDVAVILADGQTDVRTNLTASGIISRAHIVNNSTNWMDNAANGISGGPHLNFAGNTLGYAGAIVNAGTADYSHGLLVKVGNTGVDSRILTLATTSADVGVFGTGGIGFYKPLTITSDASTLTLSPTTTGNASLLVFNDAYGGSARGSIGFPSNGDTNLTINVNNGNAIVASPQGSLTVRNAGSATVSIGLNPGGSGLLSSSSGSIYAPGILMTANGINPPGTPAYIGQYNGSGSIWSQVATSNLWVIGAGPGTSDYSRLNISQSDTNTPMTFDVQAGGTAAPGRGFLFTNGVLHVDATKGIELGGVTNTTWPGNATIPFKSSFATNFTVSGITTNFFMLNGTNQLITLPSAASSAGKNYRFSMTNGHGSFVITNSGDGATLRDGVSLSYTNIGVNHVGFLSDGSAWWLSTKGHVVMPSASWSLTNTITPVQDVITNIPFTSLEFNNSQGLTLKTNAGWAGATQLWITNAGTYMITFSAVLKGSGGGSVLSIWLRQAGADVPRTRTDQGFTGATAQQCMTVNYFVQVGTTPTYFELCAASHDASPPTIVSATPNPTGYTAPAMPGVILTINRVSDTWP